MTTICTYIIIITHVVSPCVPAKLTFLFLLLDLVGFPPNREILRADGGDTPDVRLGDTPSSDPEL